MGQPDSALKGPAPSRQVDPVGRFEWERIISHARMSGLIPGSKTRGGVSGTVVKAVAWAYAAHAGADGDDIYAGDARIAVEAESSLRTVKAVKKLLVELGLLTRVRGGARRYHGHDEYRLTRPSDLHDRLRVLDPDELREAADAVRDANDGRRTRSPGARLAAVRGPVDPVQPAARTTTAPVDNDPKQGPVDPVHAAADNVRTGSSGHANGLRTGSSGPAIRGPLDSLTNHQDQPFELPTITSGVDLRTDVAVSRAREPARPPAPPPSRSPSRSPSSATPEPAAAAATGPPPAPPGAAPESAPGDPAGPQPAPVVLSRDPADAWTAEQAAAAKQRGDPVPSCEHGLPNVLRPDDTHGCALCRRGLPAAPPTAPPMALRMLGMAAPPPPGAGDGAEPAPPGPGLGKLLMFRPRSAS